jgi:hypothetical protein
VTSPAPLYAVPDPIAAPAPDPEAWLRRAVFDTWSYDAETTYYEGAVRLASMGWSLPPEMAVLQTVVNWPALAVDALNFRLRENGFRFRGDPNPSEELGDIWVSAKCPAEARLVRNEALVHARGYWTVGGPGERAGRGGDIPVIRAESRADLWADVDPRTGDVRAAVRPYRPVELGEREALTVYLPDATHWFEKAAGGWAEVDRQEHRLGVVPVIPMVHGATVRRRGGRTRMANVVSLTDACARSLTNLQGAQELLAVPQRYVLGAKQSDFTSADGTPKTPWEIYLGRFLALGSKDAQMGQLAAADLRNFTEVINLYAKLVAGVSGLPPDYLGYSDANPASADAIYASRERIVTDAEDTQVPLGDGNERLMDVVLRWTGLDPDPEPIECIWEDPATPTFAAKADGVTKLYAAGLIPREAAWDKLGYSPDTQRRYAALLSEDPLERYMAGASTPTGGTNGAVGGGGAPAGAGPDLGDAAAGGDAGAARV